MPVTPLGAEEIETFCVSCGWPKPNVLNMTGDGSGLTDIPDQGRLFIDLFGKKHSESWEDGRFTEQCRLRINAGVDDTMLTLLVPTLWNHLRDISPGEINWSAISPAIGGGIELWTKVSRFEIVKAQERVHEMFQLRDRLQKAVEATSRFFVQTLKY